MTVGDELYSFRWSVIVRQKTSRWVLRWIIIFYWIAKVISGSFNEFLFQWIPKITGVWGTTDIDDNRHSNVETNLETVFGGKLWNKELWSFRLFLNVFLYCKEIINCLFFAWAKICMNMVQKSCLKWSSDVARTKRSCGGCGWSNGGTYYWTRCFDMLF